MDEGYWHFSSLNRRLLPFNMGFEEGKGNPSTHYDEGEAANSFAVAALVVVLIAWNSIE